MNSRLLASIIAVAALTALVLAVLPDISTDSDGQSEEESFVFEQRPSMKDGKPLSQGFDDFRPIPPEFLNPGHPTGVMGPKQPIPIDKPDAPPMPPSKHPEYDHDASPEVIEANLEPIDRNGAWIFNEDEQDNPHMQELINQFKLFEMHLPYNADGPDCIEGGLTIIAEKTAELQPAVTISYKELNEQNPYRM